MLASLTEDEESNDKKKDKAEGDNSNEGEKKTKSKQMIKVGAEYIKRVEVQYCELCKVYLSRSENVERAIALHCSTRSHLKRYASRESSCNIELAEKSVRFSLISVPSSFPSAILKLCLKKR